MCDPCGTPCCVCDPCGTPCCVLGAVVEGPDSPHVEPVVKAVSAVHEEGMGPLSVRLE